MVAGDPTYEDLNELFDEYADILSTLPGVESLTTLAREVRLASLTALLQARDPGILNPEDARFPLFLEILDGASAEVETLTGPDPQPLPRRRLALRAIALASAAEIEESLFPEQQGGEGGRAAYLRRRYDAVMATLAGSADPETGVSVPGPAAPQGSFPPAECDDSYPAPRRSLACGYGYGYGVTY